MPFLLKKIIVITLFSLCGLSFATKMALFDHLMAVSPKSPDPDTGRIYVLRNHYDIRYITKWDDDLQDYLFFVFFVFFVGAGALNHFWNVYRGPFEKQSPGRESNDMTHNTPKKDARL